MNGKWIISVFGVLLLAACGGSVAAPSGAARTGPMKIVATTGMVADAVRKVAGSEAVVEGLMGPGVDPHLYTATAEDSRRLAEADAVFYNGLHLEGRMGDALVSLARRKPVFAVAADIPHEKLRTPPEFSGLDDPHVWFDVKLWILAVRSAEAALVEIDPARADGYRARAAAYVAELEALDAWVRAEVAKIPAERRVLVTAHDAFGYFGAAYGMDVRGLQGISTSSEYGVRDVENLATFLAERKIPAIFVESSVPRRSIEAVQAAARSRGHEVRVGGELFSDAMGAPGTPEDNYVGMVRHNVTTIVEALGGPTR